MVPQTNLREWMNNVSIETVEKGDREINKIERELDILLLDGGISTHLEHLIQEQKRHENCSSVMKVGGAADRSGDSAAGTTDHEAFQYRSLWSSSLLLNLEGQNLIQKAHEAFFDAGCDMISTVTYQVSHYICSSQDSDEHRKKNDLMFSEESVTLPGLSQKDVDDLLILGINLAHETRIRTMKKHNMVDSELSVTKKNLKPLYVIGSLGCYGAALADGSEYRGDYNIGVDELMHFHKRRFHVLTDWIVENMKFSDDDEANILMSKYHIGKYIDGIAFETVPNVLEVEAIIKVVKERMTKIIKDRNIAIWLSLACQNDKYLNDGTLLTDVLDKLDDLDTDGNICGVGINCFDVKIASSLTNVVATHQAQSKHNRAIVFYPNSGEEWDAANESWLEGSGCTDGYTFAKYVVDAIMSIQSIYKRNNKSCRTIVGGCCRTSPGTIKHLRQRVDKMLSISKEQN